MQLRQIDFAAQISAQELQSVLQQQGFAVEGVIESRGMLLD
jgi:hypothetical protein